MNVIKELTEICETFVEGSRVDVAEELYQEFLDGIITRREYHIAITNHLDAQVVKDTRPVKKSSMILVDPQTLRCLN